jgi:HAE1 family hydrophobic/amphiphilic exporter-1
MTSFAFLLGCVPLMLASGSGAAARSTISTGVVLGMAVATSLGIFIIPVCYGFVQGLAENRMRSRLHRPHRPPNQEGHIDEFRSSKEA